jgi:sugar lactone lactonase YvrE
MIRPRWIAALLAAALAGVAATARADTLYVSLAAGGGIVTYDTTAAAPTPKTFASMGFNQPFGLAFDAAGNLYVADLPDDRIVNFTPGGVGSVFASTLLSHPLSLAFDAAGNLYAANTLGNAIDVFTPDGVGRVFATLGPYGAAGLAFDAAGNLYASTGVGNTITEFSADGVGRLRLDGAE